MTPWLLLEDDHPSAFHWASKDTADKTNCGYTPHAVAFAMLYSLLEEVQ